MVDTKACVYVVDDDPDLGGAIARLLRRNGHCAEAFLDPAQLLAAYVDPADCVLTDVMMGALDGFGFIERLRTIDPYVGVVFMTAWPTTADAVDAVRRFGGFDYLEKPIDEERLLTAIDEAATWSRTRRVALARTAALSAREREVFGLLTRGFSNKMVALELGLSPKTIEDHRAAVMAKTGAQGLADLIALASAAAPGTGAQAQAAGQ